MMHTFVFDSRPERRKNLQNACDIEETSTNDWNPKILNSKDIIFIHLDDIKCQQVKIEYLAKNPTKLFIFYSGGEITQNVIDTSKIKITENICIINRPIDVNGNTSASDLNIKQALEIYKETHVRDKFFNALQKFNPFLEASLKYLYACLNYSTNKKDIPKWNKSLCETPDYIMDITTEKPFTIDYINNIRISLMNDPKIQDKSSII